MGSSVTTLEVECLVQMLVITALWAELGKRSTFTGFVLVPTAYFWATKHKKRTHSTVASTNFIGKGFPFRKLKECGGARLLSGLPRKLR